MLASIASSTMMWFAVAQVSTADAECALQGPASTESAWSATVKSEQPRTHFLKSRLEDSRCPSADAACKKSSYLVPGDNVLAWSRWGDVFCTMYRSKKGSVTVGRLWDSALDFHGAGSAPNALDWTGHWVRDDEADLTIHRVDDGHLDIEGDASWGGHDPDRVANGGVHVGGIGSTRLRLTGYAIHFVEGKGNSPPAAEAEFDCTVDLQWRAGTLLAKDNGQCGGMNVSFDGTYQKVDP